MRTRSIRGLFLLLSLGIAARTGAQDAVPVPTRCSAPEFQKVGEFQLPTCGAAAGETVKVSGKVIVTNRTPAGLKQVVLVNRMKTLAMGAVAASPDNPAATDITFDYSSPAESYPVQVDLIIVPQCGPVLSISVDRKGRCP